MVQCYAWLMAEEIAISKFKATCLAVLERVGKTGRPVVVTRFGHPVAEIVPPRAQKRARAPFGFQKGTVRITGDIVSPVLNPDDFDAMRGEWEPPEPR